MDKIFISENKVLKITNVLISVVDGKNLKRLNLMVSQMENYIKSKGATP